MEQKEPYSKRVKEACRAIAEHIVEDRTGGIPSWPMSFAKREMYLGRHFLKEFFLTVEALEARGFGEDEIAKLFKGPSRLAHFLYPALILPQALSPEQSVKVVEKIVDYIATYRRGDIFCRNGFNLIYSQEKIQEVGSALIRIQSERFKRTLGELTTLLFLQDELLYGGIPAYAHEYHGPYSFDNEVFIVREHYDLKPVEVYPFVKHFPFKKVTVLEAFPRVKIRFDFLDHIETTFSLPEQRRSYNILADGKPLVGPGAVEELKDHSLRVLQDGNHLIQGYTREEDWVMQYAELLGYFLKPAKDLLGEEWRLDLPPASDLAREAEKLTDRFLKGRQESFEGTKPDQAVASLVEVFLRNIYQEWNQ